MEVLLHTKAQPRVAVDLEIRATERRRGHFLGTVVAGRMVEFATICWTPNLFEARFGVEVKQTLVDNSSPGVGFEALVLRPTEQLLLNQTGNRALQTSRIWKRKRN